MSLFTIPTDTDSAELVKMPVDTLIAIRPLSREPISIETEWGARPALRTQIVDLETGEANVSLLFWETGIRTVLDNTVTAPWTLGTFVQQPQKNDPTRSVYVFKGPDVSELDVPAIEHMLVSVMDGQTEEGPF